MAKKARKHDKLQSDLHDKYPLIDTALIAAILSDLEYSPSSIDDLHQTLSALTLQAEADYDFQPELGSNENDYSRSSDTTDTFQSFNDPSIGSTASSGPRSSSSASNTLPFDTPLGFIQKAFPNLSYAVLQETLEEYAQGSNGDSAEIDLDGIIQQLLTQEFMRELEERGVDDDATEPAPSNAEPSDWSSVKAKKTKNKQKNKAKAKALKGLQTISLHEFQQGGKRRSVLADMTPQSTPVADPWMHFQSLATHLSSLLPSLPPSHFLSMFHDPDHTHVAEALRHCLQTLKPSPASDDTHVHLDTFLDILAGEDGDLAGINVDDANDALMATDGDFDRALELVWLLQELDDFGPSIMHSPRPEAPDPVAWEPSTPKSPKSPISPQPTASSSASIFSTESSPEWSVVARRPRRRTAASDPLSEFIPAYKNKPKGWRTTQKAPATAPSEPDDNDENLPEHICRHWADYYRRQRDESLRSATQHWKKGGRGNRGGEIALYYADESREYDRKSRLWALKAARSMVERQQKNTNRPNTIDLHGLTVHESLTLVRERVNEWWNSAGGETTPSETLMIITGQGKHSKGRVGVIGPAVQKMLTKEGWRTVKKPGTIFVNGVLPGR